MGKNLRKMVALAGVLAITTSMVPTTVNALDLQVQTNNGYVENAEKLGKEDKTIVNYKDFQYEYTIDQKTQVNTIKAIKYIGSGSIVEIPAEVDGRTVTAIASNAFEKANQENLNKIVELKIPGKMEDIPVEALKCLKSLQKFSMTDKFDNRYNCQDGVLYDTRDKSLVCYPQQKNDVPLFRIPSETTKINKLAFYNASTALKRIFIHSAITDIDPSAFNDAKLESIGVEAANKVFSSAFSNINDSESNAAKTAILYKVSDTGVELFKYPQNRPVSVETGDLDTNHVYTVSDHISIDNTDLKVTKIGNYAFQGVSKIAGIKFGTNITSIGDYAFDSCVNPDFKTIIIPNNVTILGDYAFNNCSTLQGITITGGKDKVEGVSQIGIGSFNNCFNLTAITVEGSNTYCNNQNDGVLYEIKPVETPTDIQTAISPVVTTTKVLVRYPCAKKGNTTPNTFTLNDATITKIDDCAFQGSQTLSEIVLSENVKSIGKSAFGDCKTLNRISNYNNVESIGENAFENCTTINKVYLPLKLTKLEVGTFKNCVALNEVQIPISISEIDISAFEMCNKLSNITIPKADPGNGIKTGKYVTDDGILYLASGGQDPLNGATLFKYPVGKTGDSYKVPATVAGLYDGAFKNCTNYGTLKNVEFVRIIKTVQGNNDVAIFPISISEDVFDQDCVLNFTTQIFDQECFNYDTVDNGQNIIINKLLANADTVEIPSKIDGKAVTQIAANTFEGKTIKTLKVPASVGKIETGAIEKINGLETLEVDKNNAYFEANGINLVSKNANGGQNNDGGNGGTTVQNPSTGDSNSLLALGLSLTMGLVATVVNRKKRQAK